MSEKRGPLIAVVALLAILGWRVLPSSAPSGDGKEKPSAAAALRGEKPSTSEGEGKPTDYQFAQPLQEYLQAVPRPSAEDEVRLGMPGWAGNDWELDFLIATVPDPIDATIGYRFDFAVDAIRQAAENCGYVFDRYSYPWLTSDAKKVGAPGPSDVVKHTLKSPPLHIVTEPHAPARHRVYEEQPGMLVFRFGMKQWKQMQNDPGEPKRLLVVLLVGENAVSGVHKIALARALTFVSNYAKWDAKVPTLLMAPFFSGTPSSLSHVLGEWSAAAHKDRPNDPCYSFRLISGSATAVDPKRFDQALTEHGKESINEITFQATLIPETIILGALLKYLAVVDDTTSKKKKQPLREKVVLLRESNTGFGDAFSAKVTNFEHHKNTASLVSIPFPLHISDVRTGYNKTGSAGAANWPNLPTFGGKLRIPVEEAETARDLYPPLHPAMTATAAERQLTSALTAINHEGFRYAVVASSDIRDRVFLAQLLREQCPNAQLLFTNADLLQSHPDYLPYFKGAVVGSTYPLVAKNQRWSAPFDGNRQRLFFPSEAEQGVYNATTALIGQLPGGRVHGKLIDYGPPFTNTATNAKGWRPPIWISVIGQTGPQPLAVIDGPQMGDDDQKVYEEYVYPWKWIDDLSVLGATTAGLIGAPNGQAPFQVVPGFVRGRTEAAPIPQPSYVPQCTGYWIAPCLTLCAFAIWIACAMGWALFRGANATWTSGAIAAPHDEDGFQLANLFLPRRDRRLFSQQMIFVPVCLSAVISLVFGLERMSRCPTVADGNIVDMDDWPRLYTWLPVLLLAWGLLGIAVCYFMALCAFAFMALRAFARRKRTAVVVWVSHVYDRVLTAVKTFAILVASLRQRNRSATPKTGAALRLRWHRATAIGLALAGLVVKDVAIATINNMRRNWVPIALVVLLVLMAVRYFWHAQPGVGSWPRDGDRGYSLHQRQLFLHERATNLTNGVSPMLPPLFLGLGFFWWGYTRLYRLLILDRYHVEVPFPEQGELGLAGTREFQKLKACNADAMEVLRRPQASAWYKGSFLVWLVLAFMFARLVLRFGATVEGPLFDSLLLFGLLAFGMLLVYALLELLRLWNEVSRVLAEIARLPMRRAYNRLPRRITSVFGPYLFSHRPLRTENLDDRCRQQKLLLDKFVALADLPMFLPSAVADRLKSLRSQLPAANSGVKKKGRSLKNTAWACLSALQFFWRDLSVGEALQDAPASLAQGEHDAEKPTRKSGEESAENPADPVERWRALAEDFVALEVVTYLSQFFIQLRNTLTFVAVGSVLLLLSVISYPLQPQRPWLLFAGAIVVAVIVVAVRLFLQIERDDVVSRVAGTTPNQIDWLHGSLLQNVFTYAVPLLGVLAAASTDMSDLLNAWLAPLLNSLR